MIVGMSVVKKLALAFAIGPAILLMIGVDTYHNTEKLLESRDVYNHSAGLLEQTAVVRMALVDAETGARGYVLTGDENYLEPYRNGSASADQALGVIDTLTADDPRTQSRTQAVRAMMRSTFDNLAEVIRIRREKGFDAAVELIRTGAGKTAMDELRNTLTRIDDDQKQILKARNAEADSTAQSTFEIIIYGTVASVILLSAGGLLITRSITVPLRDAIDALAASTAEILAGTSQQASGIQEQAASVAEAVSTVDEITQTSEQANERAKVVSDVSRRSVEVGAAGRKAVESTVTVMGVLKTQTESIAQGILGLSEQAQTIGEIIAAVNDVAEQTHLLALNAAIEASRAGEHGRGFSVVATEIRALAQQSKKATLQVRQILGEIQKSTNHAVLSTEQGTKSVGEAMRSAKQAGDIIKALGDTITEAAQAAAQITASVGQQAVGMGQIQRAMRNINEATNQNMSSTRQAEMAAKDMSRLGTNLQLLLKGAVA